jgi:hypothetical protein
MKHKRFASMVFALVMALTLAVPAFAAIGGNIEGNKAVFQATATMKLPTINVDITKTQSPILLNPLKLGVPNEDEKTPAEIEGSPIHVKNMTLTDLVVSAAVTGSVAGAVTFSSTPVTDTTTAKKAFVYGVFAVQDSPDPVDPPDSGYDENAANQVRVRASTVNRKNVARLPAASTSEPNYLSFGVFGNCTSSPKIKWTADDTLSVAVAYSFRMVPIGS